MQLSPAVGKSKKRFALLNQLAETTVKSDREVCVHKEKEKSCSAGTAKFI